MPKAKYYFNTHSLKYEKVVIGFKKRFLKTLGFFASACVFASLIVLIAFTYFDSPKEKQLKRQLEESSLQLDLLKQRVTQSEAVLHDIQERDNTIYRVIFEAEPIPQSVREAGYGGADRYAELNDLYNVDFFKETAKKVDKLSKQLYVQSKSFDEVFNLAKNKTEMLASIPAIQPISNRNLKHIGSGYGMRVHPIYKMEKLHTGMDFTAPIGTEIYATGNGVIHKIELNGRGYGNNIEIEHGYGYQTLYGHMSKIIVREGQKVKRGDVIGYVGNSGSSVGPHLHYEVRKNDVPVNPVNFYYNDLTPEEYQKMLEISSASNQSFD